jgi:RNA polymerase sigma factor (TIGR02999 family)
VKDVTTLLSQLEAGDPSAADQLLPLIYDELRKLAAAKLRQEKPGQTLDATGLVHEAYLRLIGPLNREPKKWNGRNHFFLAAAESMRRILIDNARRKQAQKRGGDLQRQQLENVAGPEPDDELIALDEALHKLAVQDPAKAQLVELRYFAGLTSEEAAEVLGISPATADRHWAYARTWLKAEVRGR